MRTRIRGSIARSSRKRRGTASKCTWTSSLLRPPRSRPGGPPFWHDFEFDHEHDDDHPDGAFAGPISQNDFYYTDNIELTTVGIDVGSSTAHLIFSRLHLQRLGQYLSSRYVVVKREMLHRSPILLTPYRADNTIDAEALDGFIQRADAEAGLTP